MIEKLQRSSEGRESLLVATLVELSDSLVDQFDVIELLTVLASRSVELLDAAASGIVLADPAGQFHLMAASEDRSETLELFQIQNGEGPCLDCYKTGAVVIAADFQSPSQWPAFAVRAVELGFNSMCAVPLRVHGTTIGALGMFRAGTGALDDEDITIAQALANVAAITIVQDQAVRLNIRERDQLKGALNSRIIIEQAKGILAAHASLDMHDAFTALRTYARSNNQHITDVAHRLVDLDLDLDQITAAKP